jgi:hypothetical protein
MWRKGILGPDLNMAITKYSVDDYEECSNGNSSQALKISALGPEE